MVERVVAETEPVRLDGSLVLYARKFGGVEKIYDTGDESYGRGNEDVGK